jgi:FtsZ-interacting cell division protein ZipA
MSDLQISLLAIGAVVIAGVYLFNLLQERKYRRHAEQHFKSQHADVLVDPAPGLAEDEPRIEPAMGFDEAPIQFEAEAFAPETIPEAENLPDAVYEQTAAAAMTEEPSLTAAHDSTRGEEGAPIAEPDEAISYVVHLHPTEPVIADALALAMERGRDLGKPVRWYGVNHATRQWEAINGTQHGEYEQLMVALQLADRKGHATEAQLAQFNGIVDALAGDLPAVAEYPDKAGALARAVELDDFCAEVDVLFGLNVVSKNGDPYPGTKVRALAESAGMVLQPDGTFHYFDDAGVSLFSLCNHESTPFSADNMKYLSTHGVTLLFDVPKVANGIRKFDQMVNLAQKMADSLGGVMVDDNRRPLTRDGLETIRQQLRRIYQRMDAGDIPAGGVRALRLFS